MMRRSGILILLTALIWGCLFYASAQEKTGAKEQAREQHLLFLYYSSLSYLSEGAEPKARRQADKHYRRGKKFYSQGRYQKASREFRKATNLLGLQKVEFMRRMQPGTGKTLTPTVPELPEVTAPAAAPVPRQELAREREIAESKKTQQKKEEAAAGIQAGLEPLSPEREYYIDIGDILDISVWQNPDLSRQEVIVRPDGKISFPLIGDIRARGRTLTQLDDIVTEKLRTYIRAPEVSIMIRRFAERANKVVILGEIIGPGIYKFNKPPTIIEALAAAGGSTKYAVLKSIMVIRRPMQKERPSVTRVDLAQVFKKGNLSDNITLQPNDIIYVPRSFIGKLNRFLDIFQPAFDKYMQTLNARLLHNTVHSGNL